MPSISNNIADTYSQKLIMAEILERLSGDYFAAQIFNSNMALDPRKGMATRLGTTYTFEKEATTTYRKLSKGGELQYDENPQIDKLQLEVDTFSYIGLKTDEFDLAAWNGLYMSTNYINARARDLAVNMEKDIVTNIMADTDIPEGNTISLASYADGKMSNLTINDGLTKLRNNGHTSGSRVFTVIDTEREGQLRANFSVYDQKGQVSDRQFLTSRVIDIYGTEVYATLGQGAFDRFPTNTTSDGVSGTGQIVGFMISEDAYKITGIQLPESQPGVTVTTVQNPNIPLGLRRVQGYDMDFMTAKDVLGLWWGDLVVRPELVVPIVI